MPEQEGGEGVFGARIGESAEEEEAEVTETVKRTVPGKNGGTLMAPWAKGVCQNPGGQPKGTAHVKKRLRSALVKRLKAHPEQIDAIVDGLINACAEGDGACQKIAWDRLDGPIVAKTDMNLKVAYSKRLLDEEDGDSGNDSP